MRHEDIEQKAREIQLEIWNRQTEIWPRNVPQLMDMFNVDSAAAVLGVRVERFAYLPSYEKVGITRQIAGLIDREDGLIALGMNFKPHIVKFTSAHELGHMVIHQDEVMHRDFPIEGLTQDQKRPPKEREADHFAACFLMPRKLVKTLFRQRFGDYVPFEVTHATASMLRPHDPNSLLQEDEDLAAILANAVRFNGRPFQSLASVFQVSTGCMAIRLKEIGLVRD